MKKINLIIVLLLVSTVTKVRAQQSMFIAQYSVSFSSGDFNKFISKESWRGATLEYKSMLEEGIGVGLQVGWNAFYESPGYVSYNDGTSTVTGTQYRYCSTVPVLATLDYYLKPGEKVNPFAGLGVGTMFSRSDVNLGIWNYQIDTWHFAIQPEVGVIIETSPGTGLILSAKYYQAWKTDKLDQSRNYFAINVGFEWGN